jgi:hypothetical protein
MPGGMWGVLRAGSCDNPLSAVLGNTQRSRGLPVGPMQPKRVGGGRDPAASSSGGQAGPGRAWWYPPWQSRQLGRIAIPLFEANLTFRPMSMSFLLPRRPAGVRRSERRLQQGSAQETDKWSHFAFPPVPLRILAYPSVPLAGQVGSAPLILCHGSEGICRELGWPFPSITTCPPRSSTVEAGPRRARRERGRFRTRSPRSHRRV